MIHSGDDQIKPKKKDGLVLAWYWNAICSRCRKPRVGETLDLLEATQELAFGI